MRKRCWVRIALLAASGATGLIAVELLLRLYGFAGTVVYTRNPEWGYLMTPSQEVYAYGHPVRINSLGLRGPELQPKSSARTRIVFIGDSITYGGGKIREEEVFPRVVASLAQQAGKNVEVVNLSAPGWSPQNWLPYVERNGLYQADIVVMVLPECDLARPLATMEAFGHYTHASPLLLGNVLTKIYLLVRGYLQREPEVDEELVASRNAAAVKRLRERVDPIPFLAVLVPSAAPRRARFWPLFESQLPEPLDLRGELRDPALFLDAVHLNARGHQVVGDKIFRRLQDRL